MLRARIITALVLVTLFGAVLFAGTPAAWIGFVTLVAGIGAWEWGALIALGTLPRGFLVIVLLASVPLFASVGANSAGSTPGIALCAASGVFWTLVAPLWLRDRWPLPGGIMGALVGIVLLLPTALALVMIRDLGPWWLLAIMASVWVADIAAYFVGRRYGRVKLAPMISPGKTREGAYGAMAGVSIYAGAIALASDATELGLLGLLALTLAAVAFTVLSIMGDLFESLAKRHAGVKDSGSILPGHGGVLDRIDSLTSTLPIVALLVHLLRASA